MDILVFTNERLKFARFFYSEGVKPFKSIISLIENNQAPYDPIYDESGEPPYIYEWVQAQDGIEAVGLASLSMLSSTLQLYMNEWLDRIEAPKGIDAVSRKGSKGWFHALKDGIATHGVDFTECPIDIDVLEQLVLARNRTQHSEDITSNTVNHLKQDLDRFQSHVFVKSDDVLNEITGFNWVRVYVDEDNFNQAADSVENFCLWLEKNYWQ
ncbi:hypothetical protein AKH15_07100 [Vibrio parahaemolyticus]|uniref:hypothetical protein n=1 Tax=Vibrio parahaemolyticus TaxID=670 RepID=UPI00081DF5FF|nr:hypothetical protein [Vibrio parahaemolyticus]OCQ02082.1 hypothetical protein AKH15_07100 [Vibrio parahaemolyticus]